MDRSSAQHPESEINSSIISEQIKIDKSLEIGHTSHSPKSPREIGKSRVRLPYYKVVLPLSISCGLLFDIFTSSCNKFKFLISDQTSTSITATQTLTSTMRNLFTCILPLSEEKKAMTSSIIRLNIALNEKNCARVISITGLYGFPNRIYPVIQHFKQLLENTGAEFVKEEKEENDLAVPNFQTAYYQVSRFLSNTEIPSGKLYQAFIKEFYEKYSNIEKAAALSKEVLEYIKRIIDNINDLIIKTVSYNSRLEIEKYI